MSSQKLDKIGKLSVLLVVNELTILH